MFNFILTLIAIGYLIYKAITDKSPPDGARFDWDAEAADIAAGMSWEDRQKKRKRGEYWTTEPKKKPVEVIPKVVDIVRYERDKKELGEKFAEQRRSFGGYMHIREI